MDGWKRTDTAIFESTLNPVTRRAGGMHYTSIENIHKVIDPLFLDGYRAQFEAAMQEKQLGTRMRRLKELQTALGKGAYFDPACGSGNFLTESFLSLRRLENDILRELQQDSDLGLLQLNFVRIEQFYGIEINDFAVAVCKTALWIAEAQMLQETEEITGRQMDFLPLSTNNNIHEGNALRLDWRDILPPTDNVKIMGNPPFVGYAYQSKAQKEDLAGVMEGVGKNIDYVAGWFFKAAEYMHGTNIHAAFVATNSITQGEQVCAVWKPLCIRYGVHINFAWTTFKWKSEGPTQAAVHCVIAGFSVATPEKPFLYTDGGKKQIENISPYLIDAPTVFIENRKKPLCDVPELVKGSSPVDGQNLLLTETEYEEFQKKEKGALSYILPFLGAKEFLHGLKRYCFWLPNVAPGQLAKLPMLRKRIENTRTFRSSSPKKATQKFADYPTIFMENRQPESNYILVPRHSSENRRYIPMGFLPPTVICGDANSAIPDATLYQFGILESNVHMAWMRTVAGRLKSDYRYSNTIVYNNFPWPTPTESQRAKIEQTAQGILDARAKFPDSSLADLYDEVLMPKDLREAHRRNDRAVMEAYGFWGKFNDEPSCVAALMRRYQELCAKE